MHAPLLSGFTKDVEFVGGQYDNSQDHRLKNFVVAEMRDLSNSAFALSPLADQLTAALKRFFFLLRQRLEPVFMDLRQ